MFHPTTYHICRLILNDFSKAFFEVCFPWVVEVLFTFTYWKLLSAFLVLNWLFLKLVCWEFVTTHLLCTEILSALLLWIIFRDSVSIFLVILLCNVLYISIAVLYRLKFHPLADYPGPFLAKTTGWYDFYHCLRKDKAQDQFRCQQKYGPKFRYGPDFLVVNTVRGLREIYPSSKEANVQKGPQYKFLHHNGSVSTLSAIDKNIHHMKRKAISCCFTDSALRSLEGLIVTTINNWIKALGTGATSETQGWSSSKDMADWSNYLTFDVLGDLCFGEAFGLIESDDHRAAPNLMLARTRVLAVIAASPWSSLFNFLSAWLPLDRFLNEKAVNDVKAFYAFAMTAIENRQREINSSAPSTRKDFMYFLTKALGNGYTETDLIQEIHLLMVAGSDTISITIAACFYYLSRNLTVLERLQSELRDTFACIEEITSVSTSKCEYLRAVITETLRIAPPAGVPLQREITGNGLVVDDMKLPAGTLLGTAIYGLHHSPEYFSEPGTFKPERWIPENTSAEEIAKNRSAFAPFSVGSRACVGRRMADNELNIALARVLYEYDIRLEPGDTTGQRDDGLYDLKDVFIAERWGPRIQFRRHGS